METTGSVQYAWRGAPWQRARTGVSLHSHTSHSKETLDFIPRLAARVPVVRDLVRRQEAKYRRLHGEDFNYFNAWWTPPLGPREALVLERKQIEDLGLRPLVSISDHDNIEAPLLLRVLPEGPDTPVSVEWIITYRRVILHLGVHNLPPRRAHNAWNRWPLSPPIRAKATGEHARLAQRGARHAGRTSTILIGMRRALAGRFTIPSRRSFCGVTGPSCTLSS